MLLARGPFTLEGETALLRERAIDTLVCKNSGGSATDAKLAAARALGVRVILQRRPPRPAVPVVATEAEARVWLAGLGRDR
ncbi:precorrin-6A/cobalt-precorrin-6A reductase [Pararhodospirillum photometricum]|uniref:Precorrin-6x reductase CbiJ/CobK n=1 Tax=Pararhodospirillum photometricum DSM 122 TaxID=1150469 RepID=H6SJK0_PARPM|nr:precorrin-6A/cobalt-precorrin-6A reductase [Pararhodospirillum photometricum]CCG08165.1 Precorrin-6x reductase CbiJ/CobK [Pararhodospirillum photometricum DSM 122]